MKIGCGVSSLIQVILRTFIIHISKYQLKLRWWRALALGWLDAGE